MNESTMDEIDVIEDALRTWPIAQAPRGFSSRVLQQIETTQQTVLKFRFTWLDYALGLFAASLPFLVLFIWDLLPSSFIMLLTYRLFLLVNSPQSESILIFFLLGITGGIILIAFATFLFTYPKTSYQTLADNS
jgi:hypothetical protein